MSTTQKSPGKNNNRAGLRVAVTGPTGEIGISAVTALERHPGVEQIVGMARRPFDPTEKDWTKTTYQQGDILDREAVDALVADADVVIHLAFIVMGSREESRRINLADTRNVFEDHGGRRATEAIGLHLLGRGLRLPPR
jgi:nucleoside-diphosphate-sugar epimerase